MEFTIKIDITERLEKSLQALTTAIFNARVFPTPEECRAKYFADVDPEAEYINQEKAEIAPVTQGVSGQIITQPEPETVKTELVLTQSEPIQEPAANDNAEEPPKAEPEPAKKPAKKKAVKKAEIAPVAQIEPEQAITQPEPEAVKTKPVLTQSEPESTKVEEPVKAADDGMAGMNLMEAARQLIEDIQDAGVEMADANARVRAKANELGLNFGSITCLIKAIGYIEAKKVAIGK